ncbi:MAG: lipid biosynthesis lauroyl acyltransferase [Pseudomonadota bacterium]
MTDQVLRQLARLPLGCFRAAGWGLGVALGVLAWPRRRVVVRNLRHCFPDRSPEWHRRVTRLVFVRFAQSWCDRIWLWHGDEALLRQRLQCHVVGEPWDRAVVLFAPHVMGLDAGWTALTLVQTQPMVTLFARTSSPRQDRWIASGRSRFAPHGLLPRVGSAKAVVRQLRDGASVYLLPDMDLGAKDAVFVPFMGRTAATVTALPRFASLGRAPVRPVFTLMTKSGYTTQVGEVWANYPSGDDAADAARMNAQLEQWVLQHPEQYYWVHRRFKTRQGNDPDIYA